MKLSRLCEVNRIFSLICFESRAKPPILVSRGIFTSRIIAQQERAQQKEKPWQSNLKIEPSGYSFSQMLRSGSWKRLNNQFRLEERKTPVGKRDFRENMACVILVAIVVSAVVTISTFRYQRNVHYAVLNVRLPPIPWHKFHNEYLKQGKVRAIVFYPNHHLGEVFLRETAGKVEPVLSTSGRSIKITHMISSFLFHGSELKDGQLPDVRFKFAGKLKELEDAVMEFHQLASSPSEPGIYLVVNAFPTTRELQAIAIACGLTSIAGALFVQFFM